MPLRIRAADSLRNARRRLGNVIRRRYYREIGYLVVHLSGSVPEFVPPRPRWQRYLPMFGLEPAPRPFGLADLRQLYLRTKEDGRVSGLIIHLEGIAMGWAGAQSLRDIIRRFRESGKTVICFCNSDIDFQTYYIACAANRIMAAPTVNWTVTGLRAESIFLRDALQAVGVEAEVIAVSPYKSAGDILSRSDMSAEQRETLERLLGGQYERLVEEIARARDIEPARIREWVDRALAKAPEAQQAGLLDETLYFDQVESYLAQASQRTSPENQTRDSEASPKGRRNSRSPQWIEYPKALPRLLEPVRRRSGKYIGVVPIVGPIIPGEDQRNPFPVPLPFLGNQQAGSTAVVQKLRTIEADDRFVGVVLYVNSPGGHALASDLIWREAARLQQKKPVVVYMSNVAASGGYYVSAGAKRIFAQPFTITGSIGVLFLKLITRGLFSRLEVRRESVQRGARAGLYLDDQPFDAESRQIIIENVDRTYQEFMDRVGEGRRLSLDAVEKLAGGRVWLGFEAREHGLVDELGDLEAALDATRRLAAMPATHWTPAAWLLRSRGNRLPRPWVAENAGWFARTAGLLRSGTWVLLPFEIRIH